MTPTGFQRLRTPKNITAGLTAAGGSILIVKKVKVEKNRQLELFSFFEGYY